MIENRLTFLLESTELDSTEELTTSFDPSLGGLSYIVYRFWKFLRLYGFPEVEIDRYLTHPEEREPAEKADTVEPSTPERKIDFVDIDKIVADKEAVKNFKKQLMESPKFLKTVFRDFLIMSQKDAYEI